MAVEVYNNNLHEVKMTAAQAPAAFGTLIDLGKDYVYTGLQVLNTIDRTISLKIGEHITTYEEDTNYAFDNFRFNSLIEWQYEGTAPTAGILKLYYWG